MDNVNIEENGKTNSEQTKNAENFESNEISKQDAITEQGEGCELTELFATKRKTVTLADTITLQAIICVAVSIAYLAVNMLAPQLSVQLYNEFKLNYNMEAQSAESVFKAIEEFVNSTPVDYD